MSKKWLTVGLAAASAMTIFLSSCKPNGDAESGSKTNSSSGGGQGISAEVVGKDPNADYTVSGEVVVAIDTARPTDYEALFDTVSSVYKNVDIKFDYFAHSSTDTAEEYLTTRAAAGTLPDIIFDEAGKMPMYISQGWVYPLDEFVKDDPDFEYLPKNLVEEYTFGGKLYALPHQAHYSMVLLNLDAFDALNLDVPDLDWTIEDFTGLLKKATNNTYSGVERLWGFDEAASIMFGNGGFFGYDKKTQQFSMMDSYAKSTTLQRQLRESPGVEAWYMRTSNANLEESDYVKKFGKGNLDDLDMAFHMGRTAMGLYGTWDEFPLQQQNLSFQWTLWPYPQSADHPGRMPLHVDHCFMTSSAKNPETAFQILRYITYSTEGNIARLSMFDETNKDKYVLNGKLYYPISTHPDIAKKFSELPSVGEVEQYMFDNIGNSSRADLWKFVPNFREIDSEYIEETTNRIGDGLYAAADVMPGVERNANAALKKAWSDFDSKLKQVQQEFDAKHNHE